MSRFDQLGAARHNSSTIDDINSHTSLHSVKCRDDRKQTNTASLWKSSPNRPFAADSCMVCSSFIEESAFTASE